MVRRGVMSRRKGVGRVSSNAIKGCVRCMREVDAKCGTAPLLFGCKVFPFGVLCQCQPTQCWYQVFLRVLVVLSKKSSLINPPFNKGRDALLIFNLISCSIKNVFFFKCILLHAFDNSKHLCSLGFRSDGPSSQVIDDLH